MKPKYQIEDCYDPEIELKKIKSLVLEANEKKGAHHKQWYLYQIAKIVCAPDELENFDQGIAP